MQDGLHIGIIKEDTDELIALLTVDSQTDVPFVVGDIIEKDGYEVIVTQDELYFEEYTDEEFTANDLEATLEFDEELMMKDVREYIQDNISKYTKIHW